jgi:hypothetical protein
MAANFFSVVRISCPACSINNLYNSFIPSATQSLNLNHYKFTRCSVTSLFTRWINKNPQNFVSSLAQLSFSSSRLSRDQINPSLAYLVSQSFNKFFSFYLIQQHDHSFSHHLNLLPHWLCNILSQRKTEECQTRTIKKPGAALRLKSVQHSRKCRPLISPARCEPVTSSATLELVNVQAFLFPTSCLVGSFPASPPVLP